jgi:choline dehydrogenase-like flavoprotein
MLRRALGRGRAQLRPESFVSRILMSNGLATGVEWIGADGAHHVEEAAHIVLAAGAMETPRLLLLSGFEHPLIGRHVMFHFQTFVMGQLRESLHPHRGRAVTHVHDDHLVPDEASMRAAREAGLPWFRGGMVEHAGPAHPILEAKLYPWGPSHKDNMRASPLRQHLWGFCMQGEDLPVPTNRIDLDPTIRDVRGLPVARITYRPHLHEMAASAHYGPRLEAILKEAGALWTVVTTSPSNESTEYGSFVSPIPESRHVMGTARMGTDPATAVCDLWGRLYEAPNVLVADSSVFVTSTGYGPTLTLVALALRNGRALTG